MSSSLIEKYNLFDLKDKQIEYINIDEDKESVYNSQYEYEKKDNKIIVFRNNKTEKMDLMICECNNSIFEIDNIETLKIIHCRNNNFIIGKNVKSIMSNDIGGRPYPKDDLITNNFKFLEDWNILNVKKEY